MTIKEISDLELEDFWDWETSQLGRVAPSMSGTETLRIAFGDASLIIDGEQPLAQQQAQVEVLDLENTSIENTQNALTSVFETAVSGNVMGIQLNKDATVYIFLERYLEPSCGIAA